MRTARSFVSWSYVNRMPHSLLSRERRPSTQARAVHTLTTTPTAPQQHALDLLDSITV